MSPQPTSLSACAQPRLLLPQVNRVGKATRSPRGTYSIPPLAGTLFWQAPEARGARPAEALTGPAVVVAVAAAMRRPCTRYGSLKVITTKMKPGYLRKNGVPYSENATVTEYFDRHKESNGDQWLTVTTIVEDPKYLNQPFITSSHFKKEPDGSKWRPTPCAAR